MPSLDRLVAPLDRVRGAVLRGLTRSAWLTGVLRRRDARLAVLGSAQMLALFALAVRWPVALYLVGPIVLGVAHVAGDVRYLALRAPLSPPFLRSSVAFAIALTVVRACACGGALSSGLAAKLDLSLGLAWIACALLDRHRGDRARSLLSLAAVGLACALSLPYARLFDVALSHAHDVLAFVLWLALFRRRLGLGALPAFVALVAALVLLSGAPLAWTAAHGGLVAFGTRATTLAQSFAPGAPPRLALALTTALVFLQSAHYAVWTGFVAQECLPGEGSPTFRMTARGLVADFGVVALSFVALAALGLAVLACARLRLSVTWYMALVRAHVWFELAALASLRGVNLGRRPVATPGPLAPTEGEAAMPAHAVQSATSP